MPDRFIEKSFLYLLCISLLLHLGVFAWFYYFPPVRPEAPKEPVFIDLQQMPELKQPPEQRQQETRRRSEQRTRVPTETAPRGDAPQELQAVEKQSAPSPQSSPAARPSAPDNLRSLPALRQPAC